MIRSFRTILVLVVTSVLSSGSAQTRDARIVIDVHDASKAYAGTTFFTTTYNNTPRIMQVDLDGNVVWEYVLPQAILTVDQIAVDAEYLPSTNTVLIASTRKGVFEIDYDAPNAIVWSYLTTRVSHDANRLENGNTLFVYGHDDAENETQVTEVDRNGTVVWSWTARNHSEFDAYRGTFNRGWTHANAVERLADGTTMISLRNFQARPASVQRVHGSVVSRDQRRRRRIRLLVRPMVECVGDLSGRLQR